MQAEQIAKALGNAKRTGQGWLASCPLPTHGQGNGDKNPSPPFGTFALYEEDK